MHSLSVALGPVVWRLIFNTQEKAEAAKTRFAFVTGDVISLTDDYGQEIRVISDSVTGVMLEDLDRSKLAYVAMALHQARSQAEAQKMAATDPVLRNAHNSRGPAVLTPGMPNGFN